MVWLVVMHWQTLDLSDGAILVKGVETYEISRRYDEKYKIGICSGEYIVLIRHKTKEELILNWANHKDILSKMKNK